MLNDYVIEVENATVRFNMASEKIDNLKEYFVKLVKHELMFQEFLALKDVRDVYKRQSPQSLIYRLGGGISCFIANFACELH